MKNWLKNFIGPYENDDAYDSLLWPDGAEDNSRYLTGRTEIRDLINRLRHNGILVQIHPVDNEETIFQTRIFSYNGEFLFLEQPHAELAEKVLHNGSIVKVKGKICGLLFSFKTRLLERKTIVTANRNQVPCYAMKLPLAIYYPQKRDSFRVKLAANACFSLQVNSIDKLAYAKATLADISMGGMRIRLSSSWLLLKENQQPVVEITSGFMLLVLLYAENSHYEIMCEVCHIMCNDEGDVHLGMKFASLSGEKQAYIAHLVREFELNQR